MESAFYQSSALYGTYSAHCYNDNNTPLLHIATQKGGWLYQELDTDATGKKMVVPTFVTADGGGQWSLADLKVAGYEAPYKNAKGKWVSGCQGGKFIASKLTTAGTEDVSYYWIDNGTIGPGWFASSAGEAIENGAESVSIPAGQGLWTAGSGYTLVIPSPEL